jgi:precorrin-6B methylase 2
MIQAIKLRYTLDIVKDRYELYEQCAQAPTDLVPVLRAIHGGSPLVLGEDFCATAAVSVAWVESVELGRAIAVDHDPEVAARIPRRPGVEVIVGDVVEATGPDDHAVDVLYVGNFSIGERRSRGELLAYLRHARRRIRPGGALVCDLYGGGTAFLPGDHEREVPFPDGRVVRYVWEQREANPLTGMVVNAMHFEVRRGGTVEQRLRDAFVYRWRLWGVPELRDAMVEAGFAATAVYARTPDAVDGEGRAYVAPIDDPAERLGDSFEVLVAGRG